MTEINPFIQLRRELHLIPETGYEEVKTQQFLLDYIAKLPQQNLEVKTWRTGILVRIAGSAPTKTIGYRTDIDALPITEETGLPFASTHPGKMHACGHDCHMSIALGLLTHFASQPLRDNLLIVFQPAEEGPGGAKPIMESAEFKAWWPDVMLGLHIAPEYKAGEIAVKPGLLFANTSELFISFKGKGGHAAYPHLANDMVVAASAFVGQMQTIISRNIDPLDSAVITIGQIRGGEVQNVIAEEAYLDGTIRTLSKETMDIVWTRLKQLAKGWEEAYQCEVNFIPGSDYMQVDNDTAQTEQFIDYLQKNYPQSYIACKEAMTGEDFGYFLEKIPGFMFWLGVDSEYSLHHAKLNPDENAIPFAIEVLTGYLESM
ncbi:N-acetyldiaminopimelate deacetylase [Listeria booriae]|uniref:N-acetyldiaminopimelate deacetylase n=1 Tax=Listeria booriae TaxID=1552123 RepID=A0A7X0WCR4_9LIST|nr:N-acetyldiaminopimelate deacetylase [Listeria booriae]MBC1330481.1 N-acetyldiaminopimelate deacetylase [Listeria booriae]MBC1552268.1 N-acetyldiaminopimelate deacetylase [Listeria booriae]MBC2003770.1 N-acetyldiaminopimelate deacetylase [Listeria booriae]MBC2242971.1 N-acetyldiaminopimelate deacetylase [Listeria booriae]MBC2364186.1 N-acetyldiaminopimelate deacetylase [Listeria booriae]